MCYIEAAMSDTTQLFSHSVIATSDKMVDEELSKLIKDNVRRVYIDQF